MQRRRWFYLLSVLLVMTMLIGGIVGCGPAAEEEEAAEENGEVTPPVAEDYTLVVALSDTIVTFDPANFRCRATETVIRNMFDGLVTRKPDGTVVPEIAESWSNPEPTVWEFVIREGIKFHDGTELTVEDVKFTFERVFKEGGMEGETSPRKGLLGPLESVEIVDERTIRFNLSEPWPVLLAMLPHQQIVSKAHVQALGTDIATNPIGSGPFKFVEGSTDERVIMERFEDYFGGSPDIPPVGPAPAKRLVIEFIPEVATRIAALLAGDVDIIQAVPPAMVAQLVGNPDINVQTVAGTRMHMFEMNVNMAPFDDVRVRQAMNYAIDMDKIVQTVLMGYGTAVAGSLLPQGFARDPNLEPYAHDPARARELLAEAGHPDGFDLVIDTTAEHKDVVLAAIGQLEEVGINATVRIWDRAVLRPKQLAGERPISFGSWGNSTLHPSDLLEPKLVSGGRGNFSMYANPVLDALLAEARVEIDLTKQKELYFEAQQTIHEDAPWVFGFVRREIEASRSDIVNFAPSMDSRINMHDVKRVN